MLEEEKKLAEENALKQAEKPAEKIIFQTPIYNWIIIGILSLFLIGTGIYAGMMHSKWYKLAHQTEVYIYNPTDEIITFKLNDLEFHTNERHEEITLPFGEYKLSVAGRVRETFTIDETSRHSIINPSGEDLVKAASIYIEDYDNKTDEELEKIHTKATSKNSVKIGGQTYEGPYELLEEKYFLKKSWNYAPWESATHYFFNMKDEYSVATELYTAVGFQDAFYSKEELEQKAQEEAESTDEIIEE